MTKTVIFILAAYLLLLICPELFSQEIRVGVGYEREIIPNLEADCKFQVRKLNSYPGTFYSIAQAGLQYEILKNISISGSFRYSLAPGNFPDEELDDIDDKIRYTVDIRYKTKYFENDLRIKNRFRYQHSSTHSEDKRDYFRNKTGLDYKLTKGMTPYIALEPYIILDEFNIKKCRLYMGSTFDIFKGEFEVVFIVEGKIPDEIFSTNYMLGIYYNF